MTAIRFTSLLVLIGSLSGSLASAQTFVIGDSTTQVALPVGVTPGSTISFRGRINVSGANAVDFNNVPSGVTISFVAGSSTLSDSNDGLFVDGIFSGTFVNAGSISGGQDGVEFDDAYTGTFINSGSITGTQDGVEFDNAFTGTFLNSGSISGQSEGVFVESAFNGTFINSGSIHGVAEGIEFDGDFTGTFVNSGVITSDGEGVFFDQTATGSFLNSGRIVTNLEGVEVDSTFNGSFTNTGTIVANDEGIHFQNSFTGTFSNTGTIRGRLEGVETDGIFNGTFSNTGTIQSTEGDGLRFDGAFPSTFQFTNSGTILGAQDGINTTDITDGSWLNTGVIEAQGGFGFDINNGQNGLLTLTNRGGRITGTTGSIQLGADNGTVILEGPSSIQGTMFGGTGTDTLRFQNIRGISDAKRAELEALVGADPTQVTTINLFGEDISFTEFENVQIDLASIQSYANLITRPGLQDYARALDNVFQLNDEFREFLSALNEADEADLNEIAGTTSGQVIVSVTDDFLRHQDTNFFNLFTKEFSTLRNDPSGGGSLAANERSGLFTREVQVGAKVVVPDNHTHAWVAGYVGNGSQDPDLTRSESDIDNSSILFGASRHVSNDWILGLWGGYVDNDATVDRYGSELRNEAGYVGINANYLSDDLFANFLLGYGFHDQLSVRRDFVGERFEGDATGNQALLQAQVGRDFFVGSEGNLKASPYLGFTVSALSMGGFEEEGSTITRLTYEAETTISAQSVVGINLSTYYEVKKGWIQPSFDAAWWHEFAGADDYGVSLTTPGFLNAFTVTSPVANRDRAVIQAGLRFGFDCWENVSFDATYFGTFGSDEYSSHGGALSATFEF
ncbi:MAG: autotransporter domain-containing protein [Verrucomicrobiota bacterium]